MQLFNQFNLANSTESLPGWQLPRNEKTSSISEPPTIRLVQSWPSKKAAILPVSNSWRVKGRIEDRYRSGWLRKQLKKKYGFKTVTFDDSDNMYQDVTTGNSVACFDDQPVLQYGIKHGLKLQIASKPANQGWYGFGVKRALTSN